MEKNALSDLDCFCINHIDWMTSFGFKMAKFTERRSVWGTIPFVQNNNNNKKMCLLEVWSALVIFKCAL